MEFSLPSSYNERTNVVNVTGFLRASDIFSSRRTLGGRAQGRDQRGKTGEFMGALPPQGDQPQELPQGLRRTDDDDGPQYGEVPGGRRGR